MGENGPAQARTSWTTWAGGTYRSALLPRCWVVKVSQSPWCKHPGMEGSVLCGAEA